MNGKKDESNSKLVDIINSEDGVVREINPPNQSLGKYLKNSFYKNPKKFSAGLLALSGTIFYVTYSLATYISPNNEDINAISLGIIALGVVPGTLSYAVGMFGLIYPFLEGIDKRIELKRQKEEKLASIIDAEAK